jgi:hypothetical protein
MKLKAIIASAIATLSLGFATTSVAIASDNYYPPERINCSRVSGKLECQGFMHQYLVEDVSTADFDGNDQVFTFISGVAFYNADKSEASIFFTYRNAHNKTIKLKSISSRIRPDFERGDWVVLAEANDIYECLGGYMRCPITSLPAIN